MLPRTITLIAAICVIGHLAESRAADPPPPVALGLTARFGAGYDSNVYRESSTPREGTLFPYAARLSCGISPSIRTRVSGILHGAGSAYPAPVSSGSTREIAFDLVLDHRLIGGDRRFVRSRSLDFSLTGSVEERRKTYFSRTAGEEFVAVVNGDTISLGRRYNYRQGDLRGELTMRWPRSTQWGLLGEFTGRDYMQDYADLPGIDPLDYGEAGWGGRIRHDLRLPVRLELAYGRSRLDYDSLTSRDFDGNVMPGHVQSFDYETAGGAIQSRDLGWGQGRLEIDRKTRTDRFMGYYDYRQWTVQVGLMWLLRDRFSVNFEPSYVHREYKRAHVGYNPVRPLRDDFDRSLSVELIYQMQHGQELILRATRESTTERNPAYTFQRFRSWVGYGIKLR